MKLKPTKPESKSSSDTESDGDEYFDELPEKLLKIKRDKKSRQSVSAEAYGKYNSKHNFQPRVVLAQGR